MYLAGQGGAGEEEGGVSGGQPWTRAGALGQDGCCLAGMCVRRQRVSSLYEANNAGLEAACTRLEG